MNSVDFYTYNHNYTRFLCGEMTIDEWFEYCAEHLRKLMEVEAEKMFDNKE